MARVAGHACRLVGLLVGMLGPSAASPARAVEPKPLSCAVETTNRQLSAPALCEALGKALARPVVRVDDARAARGESVQVVHSDVQWIVIWLVDGRVRAWTRVSKIEATNPQLRMLVRAAEALAKSVPPAKRRCVRVDPNAGHKMSSPELAYPWASLRPCKPLMVEVLDPWWLPADLSDAGARP